RGPARVRPCRRHGPGRQGRRRRRGRRGPAVLAGARSGGRRGLRRPGPPPPQPPPPPAREDGPPHARHPLPHPPPHPGAPRDDGRMGWDDPVRNPLPYFRLSDPLADREVTIRDLLCHRTGLSRHDLLGLGSPWGREEILRKVAYLEPTKSFRSAYQYNNLMYL